MSIPDRFRLIQTIIMLKTLCVSAVMFEYLMKRMAPKVDTGNTSLIISSIAFISVLMLLIYKAFQKNEKETSTTQSNPQAARSIFLATQKDLQSDLKLFSMLCRTAPEQDTTIAQETLQIHVNKLKELEPQLELSDESRRALVTFLGIQDKMVASLQGEEGKAKADSVHQKLSSSQVISKLLNEPTDPFFTTELG